MLILASWNGFAHSNQLYWDIYVCVCLFEFTLHSQNDSIWTDLKSEVTFFRLIRYHLSWERVNGYSYICKVKIPSHATSNDRLFTIISPSIFHGERNRLWDRIFLFRSEVLWCHLADEFHFHRPLRRQIFVIVAVPLLRLEADKVNWPQWG